MLSALDLQLLDVNPLRYDQSIYHGFARIVSDPYMDSLLQVDLLHHLIGVDLFYDLGTFLQVNAFIDYQCVHDDNRRGTVLHWSTTITIPG